jgi:hypothetical protein
MRIKNGRPICCQIVSSIDHRNNTKTLLTEMWIKSEYGLLPRISRKSRQNILGWIQVSSNLIYILFRFFYQIPVTDEQRGALVQSLGVDVQDILAAV